jgi:hypothetical protein
MKQSHIKQLLPSNINNTKISSKSFKWFTRYINKKNNLVAVVTIEHNNNNKLLLMYRIEVPLNGITNPQPQFMKVHGVDQKMSKFFYPYSNPTVKQSQTISSARLNIMPPTNNFEPQPFLNG